MRISSCVFEFNLCCTKPSSPQQPSYFCYMCNQYQGLLLQQIPHWSAAERIKVKSFIFFKKLLGKWTPVKHQQWDPIREVVTWKEFIVKFDCAISMEQIPICKDLPPSAPLCLLLVLSVNCRGCCVNWHSWTNADQNITASMHGKLFAALKTCSSLYISVPI